MKILIVSNMYPGRNPSFKYAGIFVKEQYELLSSKEGVDCDLFIIDGFKTKILYFLSSFSICFRILFGRYDAIHVHYGLSALFILLFPFKKVWSNVILTLHGGDILSEQGKNVQVFLTKLIIARVGKVITLNEQMNEIVSVYRSDFIVLPCGVDTHFFSPKIEGARNNVVLFPGNKNRDVKNFPLFERILKAYSQKYASVTPLIVDGFTREEVRDAMANSSALLMTSISEGSPQAIKEAMSCDMAVISTDVGDVRKIFGGVEGTAVYDMNLDPERIADLLDQVIINAASHPGVRRQRIINLDLDNEQVVQKLLVLYREVSPRAA